MAGKEAGAETPYIEINLDTDPLQADRQLQLALHLNASRTEFSPSPSYTPSRKHSRSSSYSDSSDYCSSDVSGRFDDAEELDSPDRYQGNSTNNNNDNTPSTHSAKRRRSNDWPRDRTQQNPTTEEGTSNDTGDNSTNNHNRWRIYPHSNGRKTSYNGSPRASSAASCRLGRPDSRPRRSRFVEAKMNDSVSERPPSIFLRDEAKSAGDGVTHRNSGIFRFGKAIASAFNPFGVWGNVTEIWKAQEANPEENDPLAQAERAYAELKKAGYKGTVKGSYMQQQQQQQGNQSGPGGLPDETWKAIQEKMDYRPSSGHHSRQGSGDSFSSIRSTFHDLRKAKSSLGILSVPQRDVSSPAPIIPYSDRQSQDLEGFSGVRKQKSRKDMLRQARLLKKVSNLEDKLSKARRELRGLTGEEEVPPPPPRTLCLENKPYPRKFVPGALPTLPSERLLNEHLVSSPEPQPQPDLELEPAPSSEMSENLLQITEGPGNESDCLAVTKNTSATLPPKPSTDSKLSTVTADSPSRKRKSPDPASISKTKGSTSNQKESSTNDDEGGRSAGSGQTPRSRKAKLPKMGTSDSPGSVERRQSKEQIWSDYSDNSTTGKKSQFLVPPISRSPSSSPRKPSPNSRINTAPCLRAKKAQNNLRSASANYSPDKENYQGEALKPSFYMQGQLHLDPDQIISPKSSPSPAPNRKRENSQRDSIPPVPPLPKDLAATAAKVDRRLAREIEKRKQTHSRKLKAQPSLQEPKVDDNWKWPDDIF
ncbi:hypothetical protein ASPWEDRAFT_40426 [Aspergillus wentii DTO 134E9]|uniref:Nuclear RNA binding protein n=1 Tax=Aspergillus wentii DTO 134E9 TaxID=1073089 RepID=A0A1L9RK17_ASPWE|nr:uncharacterized protein ASPWEDRAFT_40426 [Aspergillus wentii DTO 134E9]KAI9923615.1 hypothetical protein MW887_008537 [Aspergillus wentii]OJJ35244.1 hypothetical protein ASPWEDRAFT_40426 [Aspergillus wentii DTO 134E9]